MEKPCTNCEVRVHCQEAKWGACFPLMFWEARQQEIKRCLKGLAELGYGVAKYELEGWLKKHEQDI